MIQENTTLTQEKLESQYYHRFEVGLQQLAERRFQEGKDTLLEIARDNFVLSRQVQFVDLIKSCYYNLAIAAKDQNEFKEAIYFYFKYYQLNKENTRVMFELAILCRAEGYIDESIYFFCAVINKQHSFAQELIVIENLSVMHYIKGEYEKSKEYLGFLLNCNYKTRMIQEINQHISSLSFISTEFDLFSAENEEFDETTLPTSQYLHVQELIITKQELLKKSKSLHSLLADRRVEIQKESQKRKLNEVSIIIGKAGWDNLLEGLITAIKVGAIFDSSSQQSPEEVDLKIGKIKTLSLIENWEKLNIYNSRININWDVSKIDQLIKEKTDALRDFPSADQNLLPAKKHNEEKDYRTNSKYGEMSLRGKKSVEKDPNEAFGATETFDSTLEKILKYFLDEEGFQFMKEEMKIIITGKVKQISDNQLKHILKEKINSLYQIHNEREQDNPTNTKKNKIEEIGMNLLNALSLEVSSLLYLKDFKKFMNEIGPAPFTVIDLTKRVLSHFLGSKTHEISHTGYQLDIQSYFGPSPLLAVKKLRLKEYCARLYKKVSERAKEVLSFDEYVTMAELYGEEITNTSKKIQTIQKQSNKKKLLQIRRHLQIVFRTTFKIAFSKTGESLACFKNADESENNYAESKLRHDLCKLRLQIMAVGFGWVSTMFSEDPERRRSTLKGIIYRMRSVISAQLIEYKKNLSSITSDSFDNGGISLNNSFSLQPDQEQEMELDLYWLDIGKVSTNTFVLSAASNIESNIEYSLYDASLNIKNIITAHYGKSNIREYNNFCNTYNHQYKKYFEKKPDSSNKVAEYVSNFSRILQLLINGFSLPGRPELEDVRKTFKESYSLLNCDAALKTLTKCFDNEEFYFGLNLVDDDAGLILCLNLLKILSFVCFSYEPQEVEFGLIARVAIVLGEKLLPSNIYFRSCRLIHVLLSKNIAYYELLSTKVYLSKERSFIMKNAMELIEDGSTVLSTPAFEFEILSLMKLFYGVGTDTIKLEDYLSLEKMKDTDNVQYYTVYQGSTGTEYEADCTIHEAREFLNLIIHFFFNKCEQNMDKVVVERISQHAKMKTTSTTFINRKNLLAPNIPSKLKKGIFRFMEYCFEKLKQDEKKWLACASFRRILKKPSFLNYASRFIEIVQSNELKMLANTTHNHQDISSSISESIEFEEELRMLQESENQEDELALDEIAVIKQIEINERNNEMFRDKICSETTAASEFAKATFLESIEDEGTEAIYLQLKEILLNPMFDKKARMLEYLTHGGQELEEKRIARYYKKLLMLSSSPGTNCFCKVNCRKLILNKRHLTAMFTLCNELALKSMSAWGGLDYWNKILSGLDERMLDLKLKCTMAFTSCCISASYNQSISWLAYNFSVFSQFKMEQISLFLYSGLVRYYRFVGMNSTFSKSITTMKNMDNEDLHLLSEMKVVKALFFNKSCPFLDNQHLYTQIEEIPSNSGSLFNFSSALDITENELVLIALRLQSLEYEAKVCKLISSSLSVLKTGEKDICVKVNEIVSHLKDILDDEEDDEIRHLLAIPQNFNLEKASKKYQQREISKNEECYKVKKLLEQYYTRIFDDGHKAEIKDKDKSNLILSFRRDYLVVHLELKFEVLGIHLERSKRILEAFARLDRSTKLPEDIPYFNGYKKMNPHLYDEIEVMKNEYFLKTVDELFSILINQIPQKCLKSISTGECIEDIDKDRMPSLYVYINYFEAVIEENKQLIRINPPKAGGIADFAINDAKLFTLENFIHLFTSRAQKQKGVGNKLERILLNSEFFKNKVSLIQQVGMVSGSSDLIGRVGIILSSVYKLVMHSMMYLSHLSEVSRTRNKDASHYFSALACLSKYIPIFFDDNVNSSLVIKFKEGLLSETFLKNFEIQTKLDSDLKLNIIHMNPIKTKLNIGIMLDSVTDETLDNYSRLRKIDRLAEKGSCIVYEFALLRGIFATGKCLLSDFYAASIEDLVICANASKTNDIAQKEKLLIQAAKEEPDRGIPKKIFDIMKMKYTSRILRVPDNSKQSISTIFAKLYYEFFGKVCSLYSSRCSLKESLCTSIRTFLASNLPQRPCALISTYPSEPLQTAADSYLCEKEGELGCEGEANELNYSSFYSLLSSLPSQIKGEKFPLLISFPSQVSSQIAKNLVFSLQNRENRDFGQDSLGAPKFNFSELPCSTSGKLFEGKVVRKLINNKKKNKSLNVNSQLHTTQEEQKKKQGEGKPRKAKTKEKNDAKNESVVVKKRAYRVSKKKEMQDKSALLDKINKESVPLDNIDIEAQPQDNMSKEDQLQDNMSKEDQPEDNIKRYMQVLDNPQTNVNIEEEHKVEEEERANQEEMKKVLVEEQKVSVDVKELSTVKPSKKGSVRRSQRTKTKSIGKDPTADKPDIKSKPGRKRKTKNKATISEKEAGDNLPEE